MTVRAVSQRGRAAGPINGLGRSETRGAQLLELEAGRSLFAGRDQLIPSDLDLTLRAGREIDPRDERRHGHEHSQRDQIQGEEATATHPPRPRDGEEHKPDGEGEPFPR